jgi:hypothetical protein
MLSGVASECYLVLPFCVSGPATQFAGKKQGSPIPDGNLMLMGKLAHALEEREEQEPKTPHVLLGVRIVVPSLVLLLRHFWSLDTITHPVRHALQVKGCTPA